MNDTATDANLHDMHITAATPVKTLAITNHLILLKQSQHYSVINTELINRLKVQQSLMIIISNKSEVIDLCSDSEHTQRSSSLAPCL